VLEHGRVVESAPVRELLTAPRSSVTRGLLRDATATLWRSADQLEAAARDDGRDDARERGTT